MNRLGVRVLQFAMYMLIGANSLFAQNPDRFARTWQVQSFFEDVDLVEKNIVSIDFATDGSAWLAISDGLYHYDGYRWKRYTTDDGLPSNLVRAVLVTSTGTVWVGTDKGAGVFKDGQFNSHETRGKLAGPCVRRIVEGPDHSIWFCCDQWPMPNVSAGLTRLKDGTYTTWRKSDGLPSDYVSDFVVDSNGQQYVLTNCGLAQFTEDGFREPLKEAGLWDQDAYVWTLVESPKHGLLASTRNHFYAFRNNKWVRYPNNVAGLIDPKLVACFDGEILTCKNGPSPIIYQWTGTKLMPVSEPIAEIIGNNEILVEDYFGAIWIGGFERLLRWERKSTEWTAYDEAGTPQLKDSQGGVWFHHMEKGVLRFSNEEWEVFSDAKPPMTIDQTGNVWMHSNKGLIRWEVESKQLEPIPAPDLSHPKLLGSQGDYVWVSANSEDRNVIAGFDGTEWTIQKLPHAFDDAKLLYHVDAPNSGMMLVYSRAQSLTATNVFRVDADGIEEIFLPEEAYTSQTPRVLELEDGSILLAGIFGLFRKTKDSTEWNRIEISSGVAGDIKRIGNEVWISCRGHAGGEATMMRYRDKEWSTFRELRGLFVGRDDEQKLIVGEAGKIKVVTVGCDVWQPPINTPFFIQSEKVIPGNENELWIKERKRTYRYVPDQLPPETMIRCDQSKIYGEEKLNLRVTAIERFRPQTPSRNFSVSYQVDDNDWTPFAPLTGFLEIGDNPIGRHTIRVLVQDAGSQIDLTPAELEFEVFPIPLLSRPWFKPTVALFFAAMLGLAILATHNWSKAQNLASGLEIEVERKTKRLSTSERKYRLLFEDAQNAICLFSSDGALHSCNHAAEKLLAINQSDRISISDVFANGEEESRFKKELQKTSHVKEMKFKIRKSVGDVFDAIISVNMLTDESGKSQGYQFVIQDISNLVKLQQRLSESKKMEALGRMAGGIAHDFNNFLSVVMYGADLVKFLSEDNAETNKGVQMIVDAAERGKKLTAQIQTFSRAPGLDLSVIDTWHVLSGVPGLLKSLIPPTINLKFELDDQLGRILGSPEQLEQVLINLTVNACHAMPEGGTLQIVAENQILDDDQAKQRQLQTAGTYVCLRVIDDGIGMDAGTRERIFDPFFTTKPTGVGTGLGLAIVYGIIQQFQGSILVQSEPDYGTRFEMYFPSRSELPANPSPSFNELTTQSGDESILLVEDESTLRELITHSLESLGYQITTAENGRLAQAILERNRSFDLIISDVVMGSSSGLDLVRWVRSSKVDIPILVISGYPQPNADGLLNQIHVPFLGKPFHPSVLAARVREILDSSTSDQVEAETGQAP